MSGRDANQLDQTEVVRYAVALIAKPLPKAKITPVGIRQLAEEVVRADKRLHRAVDDCHRWRERAIAAEQALGLYGAAGDA